MRLPNDELLAAQAPEIDLILVLKFLRIFLTNNREVMITFVLVN